MPGLGPDLCHDRGLAFPRPWDCASVTVALPVGVSESEVCYGFGTGMWQWYERTPMADMAVNRHPSSISSLES